MCMFVLMHMTYSWVQHQETNLDYHKKPLWVASLEQSTDMSPKKSLLHLNDHSSVVLPDVTTVAHHMTASLQFWNGDSNFA